MDKETIFRFPEITPLSCAMDAPIVQCRNVSFTYPSSTTRAEATVAFGNPKPSSGEVVLLENVTIDLTRKSRMVLVGRNGSGKSTLLRLIAAATGVGEGDEVGSGDGPAEGLVPTGGSIVRNHNARVGLFTQVGLSRSWIRVGRNRDLKINFRCSAVVRGGMYKCISVYLYFVYV